MSSASNSLHGSTLPSDRTFGLVFTIIFLLAAGYAWYQGFSNAWIEAFLGLTLIFLICTLAVPKVLRPLNKAWYQLGLLMGKFVSPIVLGILFFIVITPAAIAMRLAGRDALLLKKRNVDSYWVDRKPPGPESESFKEQF